MLPGATRTSTRWKPCSSSSAIASASTASAATPKPRASAATAYDDLGRPGHPVGALGPQAADQPVVLAPDDAVVVAVAAVAPLLRPSRCTRPAPSICPNSGGNGSHRWVCLSAKISVTGVGVAGGERADVQPRASRRSGREPPHRHRPAGVHQSGLRRPDGLVPAGRGRRPDPLAVRRLGLRGCCKLFTRVGRPGAVPTPAPRRPARPEPEPTAPAPAAGTADAGVRRQPAFADDRRGRAPPGGRRSRAPTPERPTPVRPRPVRPAAAAVSPAGVAVAESWTGASANRPCRRDSCSGS